MNKIDVCIKQFPYEYSGGILDIKYIALLIDDVHIDKPIGLWDIVLPPPSRISRIYPFTCGCGEPGCNGWFQGYKLKVKRHTVEWDSIDPKEAAHHNVKRHYMFSRTQYEYVKNRIIELMMEIAEYREQFSEIYKNDNPYDYDPIMRALTQKEMILEIQSVKNWRTKFFKNYGQKSILNKHGRCA